jgi:integrase
MADPLFPRPALLPRLPAEMALSPADRAALDDLYARGTPENTRRAYAADLGYIAAWKEAAFGLGLAWPETEAVALRFVLDHARDLSGLPEEEPARGVAERLVAAGLRRSLDAPAPATLDRRIASWRAMHRMRNLASPFEAPLVRQARTRARSAAGRRPVPKSARPITREVLEAMLAATGPGMAGLRDRAILAFGFASGGRRRSEIAAIRRTDVEMDAFDTEGLVRIALPGTKTTTPGRTPRLILRGRAARMLVAWIDAAGIVEGALFRRVSRSGAVQAVGLSPAGVGQIVKRVLAAAGYGADFASAHGLRSGFLTQAALDGVPIQAAMRLSLHRSAAQAQAYYADVEIALNPATGLLERSPGVDPDGGG